MSGCGKCEKDRLLDEAGLCVPCARMAAADVAVGAFLASLPPVCPSVMAFSGDDWGLEAVPCSLPTGHEGRHAHISATWVEAMEPAGVAS